MYRGRALCRRPARAPAKWQDSKSMFLRSLSVKTIKRNEPIRGDRLDNGHMTTYNIRRVVAFKPAHAGITRHRARRCSERQSGREAKTCFARYTTESSGAAQGGK